MSKYAVELLGSEHDRKSFTSGLESVDRYLRETARGHNEKNISRTRVLVAAEASAPKPVLGYFTLTPIVVEAKGWPGAPKALPSFPLGAVVLGRMGVAHASQGLGLSRLMVAAAKKIVLGTLLNTGGIGMVVDAAHEELIPFYEKFDFIPGAPEILGNLRMFISLDVLRLTEESALEHDQTLT